MGRPIQTIRPALVRVRALAAEVDRIARELPPEALDRLLETRGPETIDDLDRLADDLALLVARLDDARRSGA